MAAAVLPYGSLADLARQMQEIKNCSNLHAGRFGLPSSQYAHQYNAASKVADLQHAISRQQQVVWFEVPMHDQIGMQVVEPGHQLPVQHITNERPADKPSAQFREVSLHRVLPNDPHAIPLVLGHLQPVAAPEAGPGTLSASSSSLQDCGMPCSSCQLPHR